MPDLGTVSFLGAEPVSFSVRVFGAGSLAKPYRVRAALKSREKWSCFCRLWSETKAAASGKSTAYEPVEQRVSRGRAGGCSVAPSGRAALKRSLRKFLTSSEPPITLLNCVSVQCGSSGMFLFSAVLLFSCSERR